jgi:prepilin peptidase CpaA
MSYRPGRSTTVISGNEYAFAALLAAAATSAASVALLGGHAPNAPEGWKFVTAAAALLLPLAALITYHDVRYRRIPNPFVLSALFSSLVINTVAGGGGGLLSALGGCALAFALMFGLHLFGAMGAGDVKLFAAVGALFGTRLVPALFVVVLVTGGVLALLTALRSGTVRTTMLGVFRIFLGLLPGRRIPQFPVPVDRTLTVPYGVAIMIGGIITLALLPA